MRTSVDRRFEKGDPVREYWLARGEGFAVETSHGRVVGQVVDVVVDPDAQRVVSLVVRRTLGVSELPAEHVQAVVPARDAFVVDGPVESEKRPPRPRRQTLTGVRARVGREAHRSGAVLRALAISAIAWGIGVARLLWRELAPRRR